MNIPCRAVLFDCDGVLVDSTGRGEQAWRQWAREYEVDETAVLDGIHGRRSRETVAMFLPPQSRERALARIDAIEITTAVGTRPIPGATELVESVPLWAVVTSASPALLDARLSAAGLPHPVVVVTADDVQAGKPDPGGYLLAARRLGVPISDCVVVEDSPAGVQAGRRAGAHHVLGVGRLALVTEADTVVTDLSGTTWTDRGLRVDQILR